MSSKTTITMRSPTETPYQLNTDQTLKASTALLKHINSEAKNAEATSTKKNLLAGTSEDESEEDISLDAVPIWLLLTTKRHIIDKRRLKPNKTALPHPFPNTPSSTICLITADPQRAYKDLIANSTFPTILRSRITRVIGISKLKKKYKSYESRRQLLAEHETFLADDRIIVELVSTLGKVFYKSTSKRPIPVSLMPPKAGSKPVNGTGAKAKKRDPQSSTIALASPSQVANEIERALSCALIHLSPSTCTAVRIGLSSFTPLQIAENIKAVVESMVEKHVPQGWRGVRGIHIKGPSSAALPIWLADELWVDEENVLEKEPERPVERWIRDKETKLALKAKKSEIRAIKAAPKSGTENEPKKRKRSEKDAIDTIHETGQEKKIKHKKSKHDQDIADAEKENKSRKERLKKQKAALTADFGDDATVSTVIKSKKSERLLDSLHEL